MRIVQLSRLCELALLRQRSRQPSHVRQRRGKSQAAENLRDTSLEYIILLIPTPISS